MTATNSVEPLQPVPKVDYFDTFVAHLATGAPMPLTLAEELHPLRMLLRAKGKIQADVRRE